MKGKWQFARDGKRMTKKGKEYVTKRKARKLYKCHECPHIIQIGEEYYDDHINHLQRRRSDGHGYVKWTRHIVCERCWKGPVLKA